MKKGKFLLVAGLIFSFSLAVGQDYAFKVLANKGANEVKSGDSWQPLKTGASLKLGDELKVSENSYVGLVHSSGKPLEIKTAKTYNVAELSGQIKSGASVMNKYTDFILSSNSAEAKKNRLSATGAVHRGIEDIKVFLPMSPNTNLYNNVVVVNWVSKGSGPYVVTVKNMFEDELARVETPETSAEISLAAPKFANETAFFVEVRSKADAKSVSERHPIQKLSPDEQKRIKGLLADVNPDVKEMTAFDYYLLAAFYEQNQLLIDAITCYEKAIKMAPDVPTFKDSYEEFLLRNKMKSPK